MPATAWIRLRTRGIGSPPVLAGSLEPAGVAGVHATGAQDTGEFADLDDAILWAAERCPRIVVEVGGRLTAGVEDVAAYPRFRGEAAAQARSTVAAAHARFAQERAADADDDVHDWYFAVHDPDLAHGADPELVAREVAAHGDVTAVHVREDPTGTPVWIVELQAATATDAAGLAHDLLLAALWPPDRHVHAASTDVAVGRGAQEVGLADHLDDLLLQLD
ncbi:hypothetical protein GKE82_17445 [Conexibacter sp. W3-3-2]|uniref:Uncharacterized protein n=1 Tax=Paraconexibacter algicola TaxID=2133960 RepID=A0A2T4UKF0_9ACTN|nr:MULTISPECIES: hypothetical protein [Solirubrobacterales]MTD46022.1 hypothetical protein [Conexibacter sp. W3-3-2]PTL59687.1 hypothetical protein C7Y72_08505 [Paraconexibacter algicola]